MKKYRERCVVLLQGLPDRQREIWEALNPNKEKQLYYGADFFIPLGGTGLIASFLVAWWVSRDLATALIALAVAAAISFVMGLLFFSEH
jgi:hypothetical protein